MIENVGFSLDGLEQYISWQSEDKRTIVYVSNKQYSILNII